MEKTNIDSKFMHAALKLARKARTSPNPRVGAVIVKEGKIIAEGYHHGFGLPHAEIDALTKLKEGEAKDSTLYITLEPCSHFDKKTPPCTDAIIKAGIKKVIIGCMDENPKVNGLEDLKKNGIDVEILNDQKCHELNEGFFHWIKTGQPFVLLKLAMTLDGRIATKTGDSKYVTNEQARTISYSWRTIYDAILVGINTILIDDPRLTTRTSGVENPARIIVDGYLRIPLTAKVLFPSARRIIATTEKCDREKKKKLEELGVEILIVKETGEGFIDLKELFAKLGEMGIASVIVEGGSEIATTVLEHNLANKGAFFIAAQILGNGKNAFEGKGVEKMKDAWRLKKLVIRKIQDDVLIEGYF
ncbi:MAG: bifunctional diaminohydroxyphosphoribosylaminopyrimidine deaminase/5-amino-6-(5-phosphoribosylamino)uracil reductase RibD [Candidatus Micrarchaeota archaeon]|nr:bifunctional diaminohydroxyphosphoribosylaminopyrimidine deaminase/5-amino-6-(5-phosphoribosylamino)uracil reductase RibD [Candidatus Micrarchaeota archaeon]